MEGILISIDGWVVESCIGKSLFPIFVWFVCLIVCLFVLEIADFSFRTIKLPPIDLF